MTRRSILLAMLSTVMLAGMLVGSAGTAEAKPRKYSWELNPFIGSRDYDKSLGGLSTHGIYGLRLGYNLTRRWEVEASYSYDPGNRDRTLFRRNIDIESVDLGVVMNFNTGADKHETYGRWMSWDRWVPYLTATVGHFSADDDLMGAREAKTFGIGGGTRVMIEDFVGVRLDLRNVSSFDDDEFNGQNFNNFEANIGATFILGGEVPRDSDGDGVIDGIDKCPGTPLGCWVDQVGCPKDSDGDGVCDGRDRCPNTPAGCPVDEHGCPLDEDGDGVCDGLDNCPGTPTGCWVDERGCPKDSDGDGVCDGVDKCPDTPAGCRVDAQGCPLDEDGDGVCDGIDQCPGTPAGTKVDARGCPTEVARLLLANVHFEFDRAEIQPFYRSILDEVATSLLQSDWRVLEIELRGHTDAIASTDYNYRLGQRRADSVKDYLVGKGVPAARLVTKSFSKLEPVAPNENPDGSDNPDGRALNRRVEMVPTTSVPAERRTEIKILTRDVLFAAGSTELSADGRRYLDELATVFSGAGFEDVRLKVTGRGTGRNRDDQARARAQAVSDYLATRGIAASRLSVEVSGTGNGVSVTP